MRTVILRRGLVALFAAAVTFGAITQAQAESLRIGYQKNTAPWCCSKPKAHSKKTPRRPRRGRAMD